MDRSSPVAAPLFSVLIVNYRSGGWLARCLDGLDAQGFRDFDVVVVDNGSGDGSIGPARARAGRAGFTLVESAVNLGFAGGNNLAAARAAGRWLVLLNPDAVAEPDWLARLADAVGRYPRAAAFGSTQISYDDPGRLDGVGDAYHVSGLGWRAGIGRPVAEVPPDHPAFAVCAAAAAIRRDAFEAAGGFDERYFCYFEDVDLCFRLRLAGHEVVQLAGARVRHAGSAITGRTSDFAVFHGTRNRIWTFVKDMPGPLLALFLPLHLLMNAVILLRAAARGQLRPNLRGMAAALAGLPAVWRSRRQVQAARVVRSRPLLSLMRVSPGAALGRRPQRVPPAPRPAGTSGQPH